MRRVCRSILLLSILAPLFAGLARAAEAPRFRPIGPDDGSVRLLAADPVAPRTLYAAGLHSGDLYRSTDGGVSWVGSTTGLPPTGSSRVAALAPNPRRRGLFYLATNAGRIYRSTDGAKSWTALGQLWADAILSEAIQLVVAPGNPDTLYALDSFHFLLLKSTDGGSRWSPILRGAFGRVLLDPNRPTTVFAQNASGLLRSTNGGARWAVMAPLPGQGGDEVDLLGAAATQPTALYATTARALFRSQNGGASWRRLAAPGNPAQLRLAVDPAAPSILYLSGPQYAGVAVSRNAGDSWLLRRQSPLANATDSLVVGASGLVFAQQEAAVVQRAARGIDAWQAGSDRGLLESFPTQLAFHPADPETLYLGRAIRTSLESADRYEIWWSQDLGRAWQRWSAPWPLPSPARPYLPIALAADPDHPGRLLVGSADGLFASRAGDGEWARLQTLPATALAHTGAGWLFGSCGLWLSADGASPATAVIPCQGAGGIFESILELAVDRDHPDRVYAVLIESYGGTHPGPTTGVVVRSEDGGRTWVTIRREPSDARYLDQVIPDPFRPGTVFLLADALYSSSDAGTTWERVGDRPGAVMAADPFTPATLYAASATAGFRKSTDGGRTFTAENAGLDEAGRRALLSVIPHPALPGVVLALPERGGLFVRP